MADNFGLKLEIDGEAEFRKSIDDINKSFKILGSEMKLVTSAFGENDKSAQALTARNEGLNKQIDLQKNRVSEYEKILGKLVEKYGESDVRTKNWTIKLNEAKAGLNNFERELKNNIKAIETAGNEMDSTGKKTSIFGDVLKANLAADAIKAGLSAIVGMVKEVGAAVNNFISEGSQMAAEAAQSQTLLAQVMRNTMSASDEQIESMVKLAAEQEKLGVVSKTAQVTALAELASFVERKEAMEDMLPVMNDYIAYQYGTTASEEQARNVATALGKAIQGNIDGLAKQGFTLTDNEKKWFKTADEAQRVAFVMEMVSTSMGGVNEALAQTDAGKMAQLETVMNNTKIAVGEMANEFKAQIMGQMLPSISSLADAFTDTLRGEGSPEELAAAFDDVFSDLSDVVRTFAPLLLEIGGNILSGVVTGISNNAEEIISGANEMIGSFLKKMGDKDTTDKIAKVGGDIVRAIASGFEENFPLFVEASKNLLISASEEMRTLLDELDEKVFGKFYDFLNPKRGKERGGGGGGSLYTDTIKNEFKDLLEEIKSSELEVSEEMLAGIERLVNNYNPATATYAQREEIKTAFDEFQSTIESEATAAEERLKEALKNNAGLSGSAIADSADKLFKVLKTEIGDALYLQEIDIIEAVARWKSALNDFSVDSQEFTNVRKEIKKLEDEIAKDAKKAETDRLNRIKKAESDNKKAAADAAKAIKDILTSAEKEISNLAALDLISTAEQLERYKNLLGKFAEGTDEYMSVRIKIHNLEKKLAADAAKAVQDSYNKQKQDMADFVYFEEMTVAESLQYQIEAWEALKKEYGDNADFMREIRKNLFDLEKKLAAETYKNEKQRITDEIQDKKLGYDEQVAMWADLLAQYKENSEEYKEIDKNISSLRKQQDKEDTADFVEKLDYELYFTQLNETEKLQYKINAISAEIEARKAAGLEYAELETALTKLSTDLTKKQHDEKQKLIREGYQTELGVLKEMQGRKERDYKAELAHINGLIEKYKDNAAIRIELEKQVGEYKISLLKLIDSLDDQYAQAHESRVKSIFESFKAFDMIKIDLPAELKKIDEKTEKGLKDAKSLNDLKKDENKNLYITAELTEKITGLKKRSADLETEKADLLAEIDYMRSYGELQMFIDIAQNKYNNAIKEQVKIEAEIQTALKESDKSEKDAKKNKEDITKVTEELLKQYPNLIDDIEKETGSRELTTKAIENQIAAYDRLEKAQMRTKKKDDFFHSLSDQIKDNNEYIKSMGGLEKKLQQFGYGAEGTSEKTAKALEMIFEQFNQGGVGSLDDLREALKFTDEEWQMFINSTVTLMEQADTISTNQLKKTKTDIEKQKDEITGALKEMPDEAKTIGNETIEKLGEGMEEKQEEINATATGIVDEIAEKMAKIVDGDAFKSIGQRISEGIAAGITAGTNAVVNAAASVIQNALAAMQAVSQISSPSKLFRDKVGKNIALGIGAGIGDEMPDIITDMQKYTKMLSDTANRSANFNFNSGNAARLNDTEILTGLKEIILQQGRQPLAQPNIKVTLEPTGDIRGFFDYIRMGVKRSGYLNGEV